MSNETMSVGVGEVSRAAMLEVLEHELLEVRFLAKTARDDDRAAAASLRAVRIQREIEALAEEGAGERSAA
jgi:hypothetical protein